MPEAVNKNLLLATLSAVQIFILVNLKEKRETLVNNPLLEFSASYALSVSPCFATESGVT